MGEAGGVSTGLRPSVTASYCTGVNLYLLALPSAVSSSGNAIFYFCQTPIHPAQSQPQGPSSGKPSMPQTRGSRVPESSHLVVLLDNTLGSQCVGLEAPGQAEHLLCQLLLEVLVSLQDEV